MRLSCRGHLTRTGGRDGAETHGEERRERGIGEQGQNSPIDLQANVPTRRLKRPSRASDAPRFVVARSANRICWHIWNRICGITATLTCRAFAHKSLARGPVDRREGILVDYAQMSRNYEYAWRFYFGFTPERESAC